MITLTTATGDDGLECAGCHDLVAEQLKVTGGAMTLLLCRMCVDELLSVLTVDEEEGCPKNDPDCLSGDGECHDACINPQA